MSLIASEETIALPASSRVNRRWLGTFLRNPVALVGIGIIAFTVIAALLAPVLHPEGPKMITGDALLWPGADPSHPLGTDSLGRDVVSGLAYGARISMLVGLVAAIIGVSLGVVIGALAGYFGGWIDNVLLRVLEFFQTLPSFVLVVVVVAIASPSVWTVAVTIGFITWPDIGRLARAEFRAIRNKDYVTAAEAIGYSPARVIFTQILPNALPPIVVSTSMIIASAIMMEAALSFMGLSDGNAVSWGSMIGESRDYLRTDWYLCALPGLAITLTVIALNFISDSLNDALNPRHAPREA